MMITNKQLNAANLSGSINTISHDTLGKIYLPLDLNQSNFEDCMYVMEKEENGACTVNEFLARRKKNSSIRRGSSTSLDKVYKHGITTTGDGVTFLSPVAKKLHGNLKSVVESCQKKISLIVALIVMIH